MINYTTELLALKGNGNLRTLPKVSHQGKFIIEDKKKMLNLSSNDYLGLAIREDWRNEFMHSKEAASLPLSSSSSRLLTGNFKIYNALEKDIARAYKHESCLLFNSGYHANIGLLPALTDRRSLILADRLVHASIIDGIRLSGATFQRYKHNDLDHLEKLLDKSYRVYDRIFVVTESIFSMDGDVTDLKRLVLFKKKYKNIMLYVDEAHAVGIRGEKGLGIAEELDVIKDIDILVGTFGKALASMGAFVVCEKDIYDYLINAMRSFIFSTALPPFQVAWSHFIFNRLSLLNDERRQLRNVSTKLCKALDGKGGEISNSHIIPLIIGENAAAARASDQLRKGGFFCLPVRPPTVPKGTARIRFSLTATITERDISKLIQLLNTL